MCGKNIRLKWFEAVIANDAKTVKDLLCGGQDVSQRAGPWASRILMECWRGPRCKGEVNFFDCNHNDEMLRPMAIHFALLLNCKETLLELMSAYVCQFIHLYEYKYIYSSLFCGLYS